MTLVTSKEFKQQQEAQLAKAQKLYNKGNQLKEVDSVCEDNGTFYVHMVDHQFFEFTSQENVDNFFKANNLKMRDYTW